MINLGLVFSFFFLNLNLSFAGSSNSRSFEKLDIVISKDQVKIANNFKQIYSLVKKGVINKKLLKAFSKDTHKSLLFIDYRSWPNEILKIEQTKKLSELSLLCESHIKDLVENEIKEELKKSSISFCLTKYLEKLSHQKSNRNKTLEDHLTFINNNLDSIFKRVSYKNINLFLASLEDEKGIHEKYSKRILNYYRLTHQTPNKNILKNLYLTAADTAYLQSIDLSPYNTNYVFYKELSKLKSETFELVEKAKTTEEIEQAKTSFNNFIFYYSKIENLLPKRKSLLSVLSISKSYMRRGFFKEARTGFSKIIDKESDYFDEALFELTWSFVLEKNFTKGLELTEKMMAKYPQSYKSDAQLMFWVSQIYQQEGAKSIAQNLLKETIKNHPLSYYSILSAKVLSKELKKSSNEIFLSYLESDKKINLSTNNLDTHAIRRMILWAQVYNPRFMNLEINQLKNKSSSERLANNLIATADQLTKKGLYLESFKLVYKSISRKYISMNEEILKILFPRPYIEQIKQNSQNFDPIIALSLIRQESGFNKRARSHVGARGLMQLMPSTARQFKRRLKKKHLYNPSLNIRLGTKYFGNLMKRYDNNLVYSLAAYNAGERRVNEWQEEYLNSESILENIENIPFFETRKYVKLIFRNMFFYKMLTADSAEDSKKLNQIYDIHLGFEG